MLKAHLFWGKTLANNPTSETIYKPVYHHLIDVAAAALRLQLLNPRRLEREAGIVGVAPLDFARVGAFLAGLHDLGKFSISFQAKVRELWPDAVLGVYPGPMSDRGHWRNTAIILRWRETERELENLFPALFSGLEVIAGSIAGHHGQPPSDDECTYNRHGFETEREVTRPCLDAAVDAMRILRALTGAKPLPEITEPEQVWRMSWRLAGLTTLADWVGSDTAFFAFEDPAMPPAEYWPLALARADAAIAAKGLLPSPMRPGIGFSTLAPGIAARPMQAMADIVALAAGPLLFIVEDTTGSGKTEAALVLAARLMAAGKGEGLYFALPTMATANAMFGRLRDIRRRLFAEDANPSLVLAHGRAELACDLLSGGTNAGNGGEENNAAWCAEWIADNRRKAFFADIGAGTIDQAFLAVLKKKHLTLRQYGLAGRVLIVDEAHAFDAYMSKELETLLEVHAAHGGSAIVLSATLPAEKRAAIVNGFRRGCGDRAAVQLSSQHYPLLTAVGDGGVSEHDIAFCDGLRRTVAVERLADPQDAQERALQAARRGAAVLVIRNAVDEAVASFEVLHAVHAKTQLFHARFAMCDRLTVERDVLRRFGRDAEREERAGWILVATQVVEQGLDLDFDLILSDLAPIDLLIQRAGRLWRHMDRRPAASRPIPGPTLCVVSPDPSEATHEKWLEATLGRGAFVYDDPGIMWRTAMVLFAAGAIRTPEDLRPFIERVYGEKDVPKCLERGQNNAEGQDYGERFQAGQNLIKFCNGYTAMGAPAADQEIGTRLGEPTVTLRLARLDGGKVVPWAHAPVDTKQSRVKLGEEGNSLWAQSEISVRRKWLGNIQPPRSLDAAIVAAKTDWPEWERDRVILVIVEETRSLLLEVEKSQGCLTYGIGRGLTWSSLPARG